MSEVTQACKMCIVKHTFSWKNITKSLLEERMVQIAGRDSEDAIKELRAAKEELHQKYDHVCPKCPHLHGIPS